MSFSKSQYGGGQYYRCLYLAQLVGILLFYPGYFFYHLLLAYGIIPPAGDGYYNLAGPLLLLVALPLLIYGFYRKYLVVNNVDLGFVALCLLMGVWAVLHLFLGSHYQQDPVLLKHTLIIEGLWLVNYSLFRSFSLPNSIGKVLFVLVAIAMLISALINAKNGFFSLKYLEYAPDDIGLASHQDLAGAAVLVFFVLIAVLTPYLSVLAYIAGVALLFLLGSRSELGGFAFAGMFGLWIRLGTPRFLSALLPLSALFGFFVTAYVVDTFSDSRVLGLLNLDEDASFLARAHLNSMAQDQILDSPILGNYGGYMLYGGKGSYSHNFISVWHSFGLFALLLFMYLMFAGARRVIEGKGEMTRSYLSACVQLFSYVSLLLIISKSIFWVFIPVAWAVAAGASNLPEFGQRNVKRT